MVLLYTSTLARQREGENKMLMSWTNREHTAKRQPYAGMSGVCLSLAPGSLAVNKFDGKLRRETSIDRRYIRH
jgi:hypothetical protein